MPLRFFDRGQFFDTCAPRCERLEIRRHGEVQQVGEKPEGIESDFRHRERVAGKEWLTLKNPVEVREIARRKRAAKLAPTLRPFHSGIRQGVSAAPRPRVPL